MTSTPMTHFDYEDRILESLRKRAGVATAGDVAADTGLPYEETDQALQRMLTWYTSHLDVDDSGNLLYRFDPALRRRGEEPGRRWHELRQKAWRAFTWLFKVWIMVTLVGYTLVFILLLIAAAVAGFAASQSSNDDRGGGGGGLFLLPLHLLVRTLEFFFWIRVFDGSFDRGHGGYGRPRRERTRTEKPVYQRIFDFVFGPEVKRDPLAAERAFAQLVRAQRGRITAADWAMRTGMTLEQADSALTASALRYRGEIDVAEDGTLIYRFDELRLSAADSGGVAGQRALPPIWTRPVRVGPLTGNSTTANVFISLFNGFNLVMSSVVLAGSAGLPLGWVVGLGWVPLVFSLLFFTIPAVRRIQRARREREAQRENQRRELLRHIFESAREGAPREVASEKLDGELGQRLAVEYDGDLQVTAEGHTYYVFPALAAQFAAARQSREMALENLVFGRTVFSSDEERFSLADASLADFDARLARELGGQQSLDWDVQAPASAWQVEQTAR